MTLTPALPRIALALALALSGCANGMHGVLGGASSYDDPSDPCNSARQPLLESRNVFSKVVGAFANNVVGAVGSYLAAKQQQFGMGGGAIASIDRDAASDNRQLVSARDAIGTLTRCRRRQVADVDHDLRTHAITRAEARAQYETIKQQSNTDDQLIGDVLGKSRERAQTYASAKESAGTGRSRASARSGSTGALERTQQQAQQQQTEHKDVDTGLQQKISNLSATVG